MSDEAMNCGLGIFSFSFSFLLPFLSWGVGVCSCLGTGHVGFRGAEAVEMCPVGESWWWPQLDSHDSTEGNPFERDWIGEMHWRSHECRVC